MKNIINYLFCLIGVRQKNNKKNKKHLWKETKRENLGSYRDYGVHPLDISTMYRIAVHETCLITDEKRIREIVDFFPIEES